MLDGGGEILRRDVGVHYIKALTKDITVHV